MQQGYYHVVGQYLDELASEDAKKRLNSVHHLMHIAKAFGPDRTKSQLIGFLKELLDDDEDIQEALAIQIHKLVGFLGKESIKPLMTHIEKLFNSEDSRVRKAILQSLHKICKEYNLKDNEVASLAKKLFESPVFSAKISSVMVVCRLNKYISQSKIKDILAIVMNCTKSKVPQVRKAVAGNLKYLLRSIPKLQSDGLEILKVLSRDHIDAIRVNAVESIIFQVYDKRTFSSIVWPLLKPLFEDPSWRVRLACILQIGDICKSAGSENTKRLILPYYAKFMIDNETELKNAAALHLRTLVKFLQPDDIINKITPIIKTLVNDKHDYVRTSLASSVLSLAPVLGKKNTNQHILSFFLALLRDDSPEVRIAIFRSFHELTQVLPATTLIQSVMPVFLELGSDKNWKHRVQCLETLLVFERELGTSFVNDKKVIDLLIGRMSDKVFSVRQSAVDTVKHLSKKLGSSWAEKHAIPIILSFQDNKNYLYRMNFYFGVKALSPFLSSNTLGKLALKIIEIARSEKVANIKVMILQSLREIQKIHKDRKIEDKIKSVYSAYSKDADSDVKYYAKLYNAKP